MRSLEHAAIEAAARKVGFEACGVASARDLSGETHLLEWLDHGYHGTMDYMARDSEKRQDPTRLLPDAASVIVVFKNYYQATTTRTQSLEGVVARYAWGRDYHLVLREKLHAMAESLLEDELNNLSRRERSRLYRVCVDSVPIMEKVWAVRAGLGWQGKNTNLINRKYGSWGFLGILLTTLTTDRYDTPGLDHCGTCTACLDACPTNAFPEPYVLDASRCISYGTIELDADIEMPDEIRSGQGEWLFGCDICQEVCPWNRFAQDEVSGDFAPLPLWDSGIATIMEQGSDEDLGESPLERPGIAGLRRNAEAADR